MGRTHGICDAYDKFGNLAGSRPCRWGRDCRFPHPGSKTWPFNSDGEPLRQTDSGWGNNRAEPTTQSTSHGWGAPAVSTPSSSHGWGDPPAPSAGNSSHGWGDPPPASAASSHGWGDPPPPSASSQGWGDPPPPSASSHGWDAAPAASADDQPWWMPKTVKPSQVQEKSPARPPPAPPTRQPALAPEVIGADTQTLIQILVDALQSGVISQTQCNNLDQQVSDLGYLQESLMGNSDIHLNQKLAKVQEERDKLKLELDSHSQRFISATASLARSGWVAEKLVESDAIQEAIKQAVRDPQGISPSDVIMEDSTSHENNKDETITRLSQEVETLKVENQALKESLESLKSDVHLLKEQTTTESALLNMHSCLIQRFMSDLQKKGV